ncbi:hypothetical protein MNBD_GAMMA09-1075 [hydrothermal vent metagenome]|uniref:Uncharacterized protein n=1 Tax=hydrothermal vent metagenome TaxID=652676 RepID=A0A3B0XKQ6_9ZZZZ
MFNQLIDKVTDKLIFRVVIIYLPFSILFTFWLYLVSIAYQADAWQYQVFYGKNGNLALLWLFSVMLPALIFLMSNTRGRVFLSRLFGAAGFFCLLASLISSYVYLAVPGVVLIIGSKIINKKNHK